LTNAVQISRGGGFWTGLTLDLSRPGIAELKTRLEKRILLSKFTPP
jgi:hypothetical protein